MLAEQPSPPTSLGRWRTAKHIRSNTRAYNQSRYASRTEAGMLLAKALMYYTVQPDTLVLSIKPSATLLANEIAKGLNLPLDLFLIRSFKVNGLTVGAVSDRFDQPLLKQQIIMGCDISQETIDACINQEVADLIRLRRTSAHFHKFLMPFQRKVLATQKQLYAPLNRQLPTGEQATVILATDGIQTGQDARNAIQMLRMMGYRGKIVLAAAVIGSDAQKMFKTMCTVIALSSPQIVGKVEWWFSEKEEAHAESVRDVLKR